MSNLSPGSRHTGFTTGSDGTRIRIVDFDLTNPAADGHLYTFTDPDTTDDTTPTVNDADTITNDLPLSMQPGWDPMTPGREAQAAFLDSCIAEGIDDREADPDGYWSTQW